MAYDWKQELKKVKEHYSNDPMQKRFSAIITGETNAGKTYLLRTARFPVHIDSFDPGGTKCLDKWIKSGDIVADTTYETEDPFDPRIYAEWKKVNEIRLKVGYFDHFGTYCIDSLTTFAQAAMNYQLGLHNRAGEVPQHRHDYNPQKVEIENRIRRLMNLPCDFIITGHLRENRRLISIERSSGIRNEEVTYRLYVTGQAVVTIPLLFDELYVLTGSGTNPRRRLLIDSLGKYIARSRLKGSGKLNAEEEPDIRKLLKKAGLNWKDKDNLDNQTRGGDEKK